MFELIFSAAMALYVTQTLIFIVGLSKKFPRLDDEDLPEASLVIAARNEEKNILRCLEECDKLEYPDNKLEIIIVDDKSTDRTREIIEDFIKDKPKFKCITARDPVGNLKGKANAIDSGIEIAKGKIILMTDADCAPNPRWAKTIASYYFDKVAMVNGITDQESNSQFEGAQALDFIYLLGIAAGAINLEKPLSAIGNNMSFLKKAYNEIGGYKNLPFSVTEDFTLVMAIFNLKKYKLVYPLDADGVVVSKPCETLNELYNQKKRWAVGGLDSDITGFSVMGSGFTSKICLLLTPIFFSPFALFLSALKIFADFSYLYFLTSRLKLSSKLKYFFAFEIYFTLYVIALPFIVAINRKVIWKGREY